MSGSIQEAQNKLDNAQALLAAAQAVLVEDKVAMMIQILKDNEEVYAAAQKVFIADLALNNQQPGTISLLQLAQDVQVVYAAATAIISALEDQIKFAVMPDPIIETKPTLINFVDISATSKQDQLVFIPNSAISINNFNTLATFSAGVSAIPGITSLGTIGPASASIDPVSLYPINTIGIGYAGLTGVSSGMTAQGNTLLVSPTVPLTILTPTSTGKFTFDSTIASSNTGKITLTSGGVTTNLNVSPYAPTGEAINSTADIIGTVATSDSEL